MPPWRPEEFEERCETCASPPGQLCHPWCDTGYTPDDYRADAARAARRGTAATTSGEVPMPAEPAHRKRRRPNE